MTLLNFSLTGFGKRVKKLFFIQIVHLSRGLEKDACQEEWWSPE